MKIDDKVKTVSGSHFGTIVDIDGDQIYIVQRNGVETDFPRKMLVLNLPEPPKEKRASSLNNLIEMASDVQLAKFILSCDPTILLAVKMRFEMLPSMLRVSDWDDLDVRRQANLVFTMAGDDYATDILSKVLLRDLICTL